MPTNKNAVTRYKYLDILLSDKHHLYDIHDLTEKVNEYLIDNGQYTVSQRCIEKDLQYLEFEPFNADIKRYRCDGKSCICYEHCGFSIFTKQLTDEEENLLAEVLNTIGQFDGLDNFDWLDGLKKKLDLKTHKKIMYYNKNPYLMNSNLLGRLFSAISHKEVIQLNYHTFKDKTIKTILLHPYLLKEYNNRWFLIGAADSDDFILNFAIDRIDDFKSMPTKQYRNCSEEFDERFDDIIGVTIMKNQVPEKILLWVSDVSFPYLYTKPLHGSQRIIKKEQEQMYRIQFPSLVDGHFILLECIINQELIQVLASLLNDVIILQPKTLQDTIFKRVNALRNNYTKLRK